MRVYRWDLDKTYLDTDFHSVRGVVRAATEAAHRKRALPGAAVLLRALSHADGARVTVVSGSPRQMRGVLLEKLALDGIRVDDLVLKDNLSNVRRGRFRAIRGQLGYKLPALLRARASTPLDSTEFLFGDDVEADALVYSLYADAIAGTVGAAQVSRVMELAGAYPDEIDEALELLAGIAARDAVRQIFIRQERGVSADRFAALGARVIPIRSWWQAAAVLNAGGELDDATVEAVMVQVYEMSGRDAWALGALAQDIVRRGWVSPAWFHALTGPGELVDAVRTSVGRMDVGGIRPPSEVARPVDYMGLLSGGGWGRQGQPE